MLRLGGRALQCGLLFPLGVAVRYCTSLLFVLCCLTFPQLQSLRRGLSLWCSQPSTCTKGFRMSVWMLHWRFRPPLKQAVDSMQRCFDLEDQRLAAFLARVVRLRRV